MTTEVLAKPIEIFYPGQHPSNNGIVLPVSVDELDRMVRHFNLSNTLLPLVPGHPKDDAPAMGYATKMGLRGDRAVVTEVRGIDPAFKAIVNSGELNRVSVKLRLATHPDNASGTHEFRHIGFLGSSDPALDQLDSAEFSANPHEVNVMGQADPTLDTAEFARQQTELAQQQAEFSRIKAEFATKEIQFKRAQAIEPVLEQFVRDGKLLPAEKAPFVALFSALPDDMEIEFSKGDGVEKLPVGNYLKKFLGDLKPRISYGEFAKAESTEPATLSFSVPKGYSVSDATADQHGKALAYCKANGLDPKKPADLIRAYEAV